MDAFLATLWLWLPAICAALALTCLFFSLRAARRQLMVDTLPTSKSTGVFMGLVELKGRAESGEPLKSSLAEVSCVWYRFRVRERYTSTENETYTDSEGRTATRSVSKTGWQEIASAGVGDLPFYLQDDRGVIRIQPKGARIEPQVVLKRTCGESDPLYEKGGHSSVTDSDHVREFIEEAIRLHAPLFVVGQARQRRDMVAAEIAADPEAPMFLISTRSEEKVSRSLWLQFWLTGAAGLALACGALWLRRWQLQPDAAVPIMGMVRAGALFLAGWFAGWLVMAYNGLVELRQRVRQGWANIDVELKRRSSLLPNLVKIVEGLRSHERLLQPLLATLRNQGNPTAPGRPGADAVALARPLMAIAEAIPEMKASTLFLKLQKQLADTEDRIALARGYFNDIASFYNARLELFPWGLLAGLAMMRTQPLMDAAGFERMPVQIRSMQPVFAGPCPQCQGDVFKRESLTHCPYCGSTELDAATAGAPGHCRSCGSYQKAFSTSDNRLAGQVRFCGRCGFKLPPGTPFSTPG